MLSSTDITYCNAAEARIQVSLGSIAVILPPFSEVAEDPDLDKELCNIVNVGSSDSLSKTNAEGHNPQASSKIYLEPTTAALNAMRISSISDRFQQRRRQPSRIAVAEGPYFGIIHRQKEIYASAWLMC
jgi:hypothetical protein